MRYIVVDFESYYDSKTFTLRKMSTPEYIGDKRFKPLGLAIGERIGDKVETKFLRTVAEIKEWLKQFEGDDDYCFVAHNGYFDFAILSWWFKFVPAKMLCTILIANHVLGAARESGARNDLKSLAERLGLEAKGRLDFMDGVETPSDEQWGMLEMYAKTDARLGLAVLEKLLPHVSNQDTELWLIDHTLRLYCTRPLILNNDTVTRAEKLIEVRRTKAVDEVMEALDVDPDRRGEFCDMLASNAQFKECLDEQLDRYKVPPPMKTRALTKTEIKKAKAAGITNIPDFKQVPAMAKSDESFISLASAPYQGIRTLVTARLIEKSSDTSASRLGKMRRVASGIGMMPVHLVYYGAHTGRFAGGGGFNFQNLTNPDRASDIGQKEIATAIREAFEAPKGYVFVGADASQIEARVSAWIAGQWDLLTKFRKKEDVYSSFISGVLGREIRKTIKTDEPDIASDLKIMRGVGKEAVLGLGYSMGAPKFQLRLRSNADIASKFIAGDFNEEFCKRVVKKYREDHEAIVGCWEDLNAAFFVAKDKGARSVGPIKFRAGTPIGSKLPVVRVLLPNGRWLNYRDIRKEANKDKRDGFEWKHGGGQRLYGGLLLENVTQAVSRDVITDTIIKCELEMQAPIVLHVHDSVVALVPEGRADDVQKQIIQSLSESPEWADKRLVLDAEGKQGDTLVT